MNWDNATVLKFLELYQINMCIWDPQNEFHKNRQHVNDAWNAIKENLNVDGVACTVKELKKKKESLMSAYRNYKTKIKKSERSGSGTSDIYQPTWFAFSLMDSFLGSLHTCNTTRSTEDGEPTEERNEDQNSVSTDQNSISHDDVSNLNEQLQGSSASQTSSVNKRRLNNPPELIMAKKRMDEAYNLMQLQLSQHLKVEDECSTFGVLVAKKLRKYSEDRRDVLMGKIYQLFIEENSLLNYSSSMTYTPSPLHTPTDVESVSSVSTRFPYTPSPPHINMPSPPELTSQTDQDLLIVQPETQIPLMTIPRNPAAVSSYTPTSPQDVAYYVEFS